MCLVTDPTVNRLEALAAEKLGKEAAMLVPSGTMANLSALLTHCNRGDEAIMGDRAHTFLYEAGGSAVLGGIHPRPLLNRPDGTLDLEQLEAAIRPKNVHFPRTRLICLENTHNRCGGAVLPPSYLQADAGHCPQPWAGHTHGWGTTLQRGHRPGSRSPRDGPVRRLG